MSFDFQAHSFGRSSRPYFRASVRVKTHVTSSVTTWGTNSKFTVDNTTGEIKRSSSGTLTANTIEQVAIRHTYSDGPDYYEVVTFRIYSGSSVSHVMVLPVPTGSLLTEDPGGLHAFDFIDGTLRGSTKVRGAVGPA